MRTQNQNITLPVVLSACAFLGSMFFGLYLGTSTANRRDAEWREAARPIFAARGVPDKADKAEPKDLANALDAGYAMTHYEASKLSPYWSGHGAGTMIAIYPANQKWGPLN